MTFRQLALVVAAALVIAGCGKGSDSGSASTAAGDTGTAAGDTRTAAGDTSTAAADTSPKAICAHVTQLLGEADSAEAQEKCKAELRSIEANYGEEIFHRVIECILSVDSRETLQACDPSKMKHGDTGNEHTPNSENVEAHP